MPRIRRRSTRTSSIPTSTRRSAPALWAALRDVVLFWVEQGVRIFRVDNPHTKPLPFWEWLIREVQARDPDVIFLSEAFTRPKVMKALAKLGFTQSYTYFTWRTTKAELTDYLTELTRYPEREYFRPNFFVNTPDIMPFHLQTRRAPGCSSRASRSPRPCPASYGVYSGFELCEHDAGAGQGGISRFGEVRDQGARLERPGNIKDYIARLNRLRRANPALLQTANLRFRRGRRRPGDRLRQGIGRPRQCRRGRDRARRRGPREFWLHFGDLRDRPARRAPAGPGGREPGDRRTPAARMGRRAAAHRSGRRIRRCCSGAWHEGPRHERACRT